MTDKKQQLDDKELDAVNGGIQVTQVSLNKDYERDIIIEDRSTLKITNPTLDNKNLNNPNPTNQTDLKTICHD